VHYDGYFTVSSTLDQWYSTWDLHMRGGTRKHVTRYVKLITYLYYC
jgi:hypothetical protein